MKLTKDEARILGEAMATAKYEIIEKRRHMEGLFEKLIALELRLDNEGKDRRRTGRKSQDDFDDVLKRFAKK